jgi:hypothetical protein
MFSRAKIISIAFERPCCAERNVCKSVFGFGIVNFPFTLNCGIKRIKPSGLHNNSDCSDKVAAPERDEADNATARTTVLIEKINIAEILRMNSQPTRPCSFFLRPGKPSTGCEQHMSCLDSSDQFWLLQTPTKHRLQAGDDTEYGLFILRILKVRT